MVALLVFILLQTASRCIFSLYIQPILSKKTVDVVGRFQEEKSEIFYVQRNPDHILVLL